VKRPIGVLRTYVGRVVLNGMLFDVQAEKQAASQVRQISEADVNALEGRLLLQAGALEDAERELTQAVKQQPTHAAAQIGLALLRLAQDREDDAIAGLQQVVAANQADAAAHYFLGVSLERAWRHEEAIAAFTKATNLAPRNPSFWSGLNSAALGLARDAQAAAALGVAMQLEWSPGYYWGQGFQALRLGRDDLAAKSIVTYLELRGIGVIGNACG